MGTQLGVILGTAGYMAPEQAKGKPTDRRADVWAFGVVLYEMLTGRRLFEGEDASETLAAVLTREPDWQQLPASTPLVVRRLLARCLARDSPRAARLDVERAARHRRGAELRPLFPSEFQETHPRFSPSGRWVGYVSDVTGRREVYARPLSGEAGAVRLSAEGGEHPIWRRQGGELYYLSPSDEFVAVDVSRLEETRQAGARRTLFRLVVNDVIRGAYAPYDVTADGQRFLVNVPEPSEPLTLIQGLTRLVEPRR